MTLGPEQCREARRKLDFTLSQMARALGLSDGRAVRRFEAPDGSATARTPQGPCAVLYRLILDGKVGADDLD